MANNRKARGKKSRLLDEVDRVIRIKERGFRTRRARYYALRAFVLFLIKLFHLLSFEQVRTVHLHAYADFLLGEGLSIARIQNIFSHIRYALRKCGRGDLVKHPHTSNESLGIAGRKREGVRDPIDRTRMGALRDAARIEEPGVALAIELCWLLGLRAEESVMCMKSLPEWERVLAHDSGPYQLTVAHGTKGGRVRQVPVLEREATLDAVRRARACVKDNGGVLIPGDRPCDAKARLYTVAAKIGMTGEHSPHALRYGYAMRYLDSLLSSGLNEDDAFRFVANALGHGQGRKSWVEAYYCRSARARMSDRPSLSVCANTSGPAS